MGRSRATWLGPILFGALGVLAPLRAAAQPVQGVELSWDAPASCPSSDALLVETRRLLGPDFRHAGELRVELTIEPRGDGYALRLEMEREGAKAQRELEMPSCAEVRQAAALLIALVLDPDLEVGPEPEPEPEPDPEPQPGPSDPADAFQVLIGAPLVGVDTGVLPGAGLALGGWLGVRFWRLQLELGALYLVPRGVVAVHSGERLDVPLDLIAGRANLCGQLLREPDLWLGPCGGFLVGRIEAAPELQGADSGAQLLIAPELSLAANLDIISLISLRFSLGTRFPLRAPRFVLRSAAGEEDAHEVPGASVTAELSLVFRL